MGARLRAAPGCTGSVVTVDELGCDVVGRGPRLVLVHGFTQTGRCWGPVAADLAVDHELVLVDAPGHGRSTSVDVSFAEAASLIGAAGGRATYLGYSMGGRLCLRLALDRPEIVDRVVLVGASPGLASPDERAARRAADDELAEHLIEVGIETFIDEWLAQPLFAGLPPSAACRAERLQNATIGLASSLRRSGAGAQDPLWDRLPELTMPVLLITGADDAKFTAVAAQMAAEIGRNATHLVVAGAGHTAHLEAPDRFLAKLREWLG
jgi:2-succinyl-6-hydroxy-2,4-cyclohexadiene-1-carboxylate synthase